MFDTILEFINQNLMAASGVIGFAIEMGLRKFPSEKPLGIAYLIAGTLNKIGSIFTGLGKFMDKVLPQNVKLP